MRRVAHQTIKNGPYLSVSRAGETKLTGPKTSLGGLPGGGDMVCLVRIQLAGRQALQLAVNQFDLEVLPVMMPLMAPMPMGRPTSQIDE